MSRFEEFVSFLDFLKYSTFRMQYHHRMMGTLVLISWVRAAVVAVCNIGKMIGLNNERL